MVARAYTRVNPATRWERSLARAESEGTTAYRLNPTRWMVSSTSNPTEAHLVLTHNARVTTCDCRGFSFYGHCKHAALVGEELNREARPARVSLTSLFI